MGNRDVLSRMVQTLANRQKQEDVPAEDVPEPELQWLYVEVSMAVGDDVRTGWVQAVDDMPIEHDMHGHPYVRLYHKPHAEYFERLLNWAHVLDLYVVDSEPLNAFPDA